MNVKNLCDSISLCSFYMCKLKEQASKHVSKHKENNTHTTHYGLTVCILHYKKLLAQT